MKRIVFNPSRLNRFNPAIEMGVEIKTKALNKYAHHHGNAALGQMMYDIREASQAQNRAALLAFPIVGAVVTRPVGGTLQPY